MNNHPLKDNEEARLYLQTCVKMMPPAWFASFDGRKILSVLDILATNTRRTATTSASFQRSIRDRLVSPNPHRVASITEIEVWAFIINAYGGSTLGDGLRSALCKYHWPSRLSGFPPIDEDGEMVLLKDIFAGLQNPEMQRAVHALEIRAAIFREMMLDLRVEGVGERIEFLVGFYLDRSKEEIERDMTRMLGMV